MKKLTILTTAMVLTLGFTGTVMADEYADAVAEDGINNASCAGSNCDGSAADALGIPDGAYASLGEGGHIILNFTDNVCLVTVSDDITVTEIGAPEDYSVAVGLIGSGVGATTVTGIGTDDLDLSPTGVASFNQIKITDIEPTATGHSYTGVDIDAVQCWNVFDLGIDHIQKVNTGLDTIHYGVDYQQQFSFNIVVTNSLGEDLSNIVFVDTIPAEFDLVGEPTVVDGNCTITDFGEGGAKGKGKGNQKLAPDYVKFTAALGTGESCTLSVTIATDDDHPGKGNSPDFTPTSCDGGIIYANDGVQIVDTMGTEENGDDVLLFVDDDRIELICDEATFADSIIDCDGIASSDRGCPAAQEVVRGALLTNWPTGRYTEGIDGFDTDGSGSWTLGDDIHLEDPSGTCSVTAIRDGYHDLGADCKLLDLDGSLANGVHVSCDFETGTFCTDSTATSMVSGATGNVTFSDSSGNGFYDAGANSGGVAEDIVLDVNKNGFYD